MKKMIKYIIIFTIVLLLIILLFDYFNVLSIIGINPQRFNPSLLICVVTIVSGIIGGALTLFGVIMTI